MDLKEVYNKIADGWSSLRQHPHPKEIIEIRNWKGRILDLGCGNGVNLQLFKDSELYGIDFSDEMIRHARELCKKKGIDADLRTGDVLNLPYDDNFFDYIIFSKVFSHIKPADQERALSEIKRVLKGKIFIAAWNYDYTENKGKRKERMIPWTTGGKTFYRYYYFFEQDELISLLERNGFKAENILTEKDGQNICIIAGVSERSNVQG